jgi:hypothetical protein
MHFSSPHACHMPRPSHSSSYDHPNNIWRGEQIVKLVQHSPFPCYLFPPRPLCFPQQPILKHPQPMFVLQSSTPIKTTGKITVLRILILMFMDGKLEDTRFWTEQ